MIGLLIAPIKRAALSMGSVDDDFLVSTNMGAMLEELDPTALPASSANEALEILRREPVVGLVITRSRILRCVIELGRDSVGKGSASGCFWHLLAMFSAAFSSVA